MADFALDPRLEADSAFVADGALSQVRLMDDARFPWLLLVPRVAGVSEWIDKLNIGALGNIVRQLHVHLIGRHEGDAAWPGPVWGSGTAQRLDADVLQTHVAAWRQRLR